MDLRTGPPSVYQDFSRTNWKALTWKNVGKPYLVENYSRRRKSWEERNGAQMPVPIQWKHMNRNLHELFHTDISKKYESVRKKLTSSMRKLRIEDANATLQEIMRLKAWNYLHLREDAIWDPRGKRVFFGELDLKKPEILVLGAGDGFDAMLLLSMYPHGHAVLVDFDDFCRSDRFGKFPDEYPFLGKDPKTGYWNVFNKDDLNIDFAVGDIQDLPFGRKFDIVISSGLIEHYPDKYKPLVFHYHRQFLKPGGYAIMTSARNHVQMRTFYHVMADLVNYGYRELMGARQLGLYAYESGSELIRCGHIKAHNIIVAKER